MLTCPKKEVERTFSSSHALGARRRAHGACSTTRLEVGQSFRGSTPISGFCSMICGRLSNGGSRYGASRCAKYFLLTRKYAIYACFQYCQVTASGGPRPRRGPRTVLARNTGFFAGGVSDDAFGMCGSACARYAARLTSGPARLTSGPQTGQKARPSRGWAGWAGERASRQPTPPRAAVPPERCPDLLHRSLPWRGPHAPRCAPRRSAPTGGPHGARRAPAPGRRPTTP